MYHKGIKTEHLFVQFSFKDKTILSVQNTMTGLHMITDSNEVCLFDLKFLLS